MVLSNSRLNRRVGLSFLYFIQGVPQGLIYFSLIDWLASKDFSIGDIAIITSIASLPWTLKFIIGPFIDSYQLSKMGKRKPWILSSLILLSLISFFENWYKQSINYKLNKVVYYKRKSSDRIVTKEFFPKINTIW